MTGAHPLAGVRLAVVAVADNMLHPAELVELAVVHVDGGRIVRGPLVWTVQPERFPQPWATYPLRVSPTRVVAAPPWCEVSERVAEALEGRVLVAHNLPHAFALLGRYLPEWRPLHTVDVSSLARRTWPEVGRGDLPTLLARAGVAPNGREPRTPAYAAAGTADVLLAMVTADRFLARYVTGIPRLR